MAIPVQTWGTLGSLVPEQREFGEEANSYLESNEVYDLFSYLMRQVVVNQPPPDKLLQFLQDQLRTKPSLAVCVIGPPGINRGKYCQHIATEYQVQHIHVGKLLSQAARQKKEIKDVMDAGNLVEDSIVIDLVKAEIQKYGKTGWVLDGFPRTKVQAQAICTRDIGFVLDRVLLLHTGEEAIRANFAAKVGAAMHPGMDKEGLIHSRLQQYQRHAISIAEVFKNTIRQIEVSAGEEGFDAIMNVIKGNLLVRPYANVPLRNHRLCIIGAPASGRTSYCRALAKQYGLVHIDVAQLLRKQQQEKGKVLETVPLEWLGDEEICGIVGQRLRHIDCIRKGWVLDGFPNTPAQAEFLRQAHYWPTRLIHVQAPIEMVLSRTADRKVDPVTGAAYYHTPSNPTVAERVITADYDTVEKVKERYKLYSENVEYVLRCFPVVASTIPVDDEVTEIVQTIIAKVNKPLPTELAQSPEE
mmetsp:Transcript_67505/g.141092  ORF Transcript_67505/g.141092 Transcript_67505/m.141092 type:complete len:470 (-) Transcript_67505:120-1529(-)